MTKNGWVTTDLDGFAKTLDRKGKAFALFELVSNAWDTNAKNVTVTLEPVPGKPQAVLTVEDDDPEGFVDLSHSYTMFAESHKKGDAAKRGRFNLGEKLVLALAEEAKVESTTGAVLFNPDGTRTTSRAKREKGSKVTVRLRLTREEIAEIRGAFATLIPPPHAETRFDGAPLPQRKPVAEFEATLPTVLADEEGRLRPTARKTMVKVYEPLNGEIASIYELGIPVVETGDRYHVDVAQKVPVNMDRDNVPPSYLRKVRALVLEAVAGRLTKEQAEEAWVTQALTDPDIKPEAVETTMTTRFGEKRAIFDPSDPEANNRLVAQGYTVVPGGSLPKAAWSNVKSSGAMLPSGTIRPTPKPYSDDPNAPNVKIIPKEEWTEGMHKVAELAEVLAKHILDRHISVAVVHTTNHFGACYGPSGNLDFNLLRLGHRFFNEAPLSQVVSLICHEFGHEVASNHLSEAYYDALTDFAGKGLVLALRKPELFSWWVTQGRVRT